MNLTPEEIAADPNTPADRLCQLAKSSDLNVLFAIAQNPNSPPKLLEELFEICPSQVLKNPALELILLEKTDLLESLYKVYPRYFSRNKLPDFILNLVITNPTNWVLKNLA